MAGLYPRQQTTSYLRRRNGYHGFRSCKRCCVYSNILALLADVTDEVFNVGVQRETSLKELLETLLKVNNCQLEPVFKEANSVNPVKKRIADLSK
ncbi:MAG: hypothetical protein U0T77_07470 [Chitinophagales bacterium]